MGRRAHRAEPFLKRQVEAMAAYGVPEEKIARVVGIDAKTLRKHYRDELDTGQTKANSKVAESLYRKATGEGPQSVTAAIFWLKTRAQWKETAVSEVIHDTSDSVKLLMERIAVNGQSLHGSDRLLETAPEPPPWRYLERVPAEPG
jgi:hypothetical protein